jgi:hypothetical protein
MSTVPVDRRQAELGRASSSPGWASSRPTCSPAPRPSHWRRRSPSTCQWSPPGSARPSRRAYESYWRKVVDQWGARRLEFVRANVVSRSNARGCRPGCAGSAQPAPRWRAPHDSSEDEFQALVQERGGVHRCLRPIPGNQQAELRREHPLTADAVRRVIASRRHQPGARVAGDAVARPPVGGDGERLLRGFLGEVEVAEEADQGGQDATPLLTEVAVERATNRPPTGGSRRRRRSGRPARGRRPRWRRRGRRLRG